MTRIIELPLIPIYSIVFIHGLRGHPKQTWTSKHWKSSELAEKTSSRRWRPSIFSSRSSSSHSQTAIEDDQPSRPEVFWPQDFLPEDMPEALIWTYGYNANVVGGFFTANNQNSISQHGRDLASKIKSEILDTNEV